MILHSDKKTFTADVCKTMITNNICCVCAGGGACRNGTITTLLFCCCVEGIGIGFQCGVKRRQKYEW